MSYRWEMRSQVKGGVVVDAFKAHEEFGSGVLIPVLFVSILIWFLNLFLLK